MTQHQPRPATPELLSRVERELTLPMLDVLYQFADGACDALRKADPGGRGGRGWR
jgi:hypothetical protein